MCMWRLRVHVCVDGRTDAHIPLHAYGDGTWGCVGGWGCRYVYPGVRACVRACVKQTASALGFLHTRKTTKHPNPDHTYWSLVGPEPDLPQCHPVSPGERPPHSKTHLAVRLEPGPTRRPQTSVSISDDSCPVSPGLELGTASDQTLALRPQSPTIRTPASPGLTPASPGLKLGPDRLRRTRAASQSRTTRSRSR